MKKANKPHSSPVLIAHRGYSHLYPENTLLALEQAFASGACFVECDVQLSKDNIPVLVHDSELQRTTDVQATVQGLTYSELQKLSAGFRAKFADRFVDEKIPSLERFVNLIKSWPNRSAFIELKRASIRQFGIDRILQTVEPLLAEIKEQVVLISFNEEIIRRLKKAGDFKTGWIIEEWTEDNYRKVCEMQPDYFFVDYECLPEDFSEFSELDGEWVLYEIDDPKLAEKFLDRGVGCIETNDIGGMLKSERFRGSGCA